jgi:hypothetical protein
MSLDLEDAPSDATPEVASPKGGGFAQRLRRRHVIIACLALIAVTVAVVLMRNDTPSNSAIEGSNAVTEAQLADQYGVKIDLIGIIASGGLVELRFQVLDADKASALFGEVDDMPKLAVEGSSRVLTSAKGMKHGLKLLDGATYFFLYTNVANSVHDGSLLSFVINGVRLPHLEVLK